MIFRIISQIIRLLRILSHQTHTEMNNIQNDPGERTVHKLIPNPVNFMNIAS